MLNCSCDTWKLKIINTFFLSVSEGCQNRPYNKHVHTNENHDGSVTQYIIATISKCQNTNDMLGFK